MFKFLVILVLVPSIFVLCQNVVDDDNSTLGEYHNHYGVNMFDQLEKRITDCFFVNNNMSSVELICGNSPGNYSKDNCYSTIFGQRFHRPEVKKLKTGRCQSLTFNGFISDVFRNVTILDISFLGAYSLRINAKSKFRYLKKLIAAHNRINGSAFRTVGDFELVDVSHNKLWAVYSSFFVGAVTTINLSHNSITSLSSLSFANVTKLRSIDLSNNLMEFLDPDIFLRQRNTLEVIYLENNRIKRLIDNSEILPSFPSLHHLNLAGNLIEDLSHIWLFDFASTLQHLNVSHNRISSIWIEFSFITLKLLDVSYNRLEKFNLTFETKTPLEVLNLEGNELRHLEIDALKLENLSTIGIAKNRFSCEYAKHFVEQWNGLKVIGDACDQKEDGNYDHRVKYLLVGSLIALAGCMATIFIWLIQRKRPHEEERFCELNSEISSYIYEEPIYSEIASTTISDTEQYDHLKRDPLPLSPVLLHYDNFRRCNKDF